MMREPIRLVLCGLVTGVVWYLADAAALGFIAPDFLPSVQRGAAGPPLGGGYFFAIDMAMGIWAVWLYSALVPRYGARAITVVITGAAWWIVKTLQSAKWAGLGIVALEPQLAPIGLATLGAALLASAAGASLYRATGVPARE